MADAIQNHRSCRSLVAPAETLSEENSAPQIEEPMAIASVLTMVTKAFFQSMHASSAADNHRLSRQIS